MACISIQLNAELCAHDVGKQQHSLPITSPFTTLLKTSIMPAIPPQKKSEPLPPPLPPSAAERAVVGNVENSDNQENISVLPNDQPSQDLHDEQPPSQQELQEVESLNQNKNKKSHSPSHPPQILPTPILRFQIHDLSHSGIRHFLSAIDISHILQEALDTVCRILYNASIPRRTPDTTTAEDQPDTTTAPTPTPHPPIHPPIPPIRSVTLVLDPMDGVAYTSGIPLDDMHKEIHLSLSYISHVASRPSQNPTDAIAKLKHELTGVIVHEMVHTVQNNGLGTAPGGLIEGVSDWIRLRAGLAAPHWKRPSRRDEIEGQYGWDAAYEKTAFFLEWLEGREGGEGLVVRMNGWLREGKYEGGDAGDGGFWKEVCGEGVDALWQGYLEWVEEEGEMAEAIRLSLVGEEENGEGEGT